MPADGNEVVTLKEFQLLRYLRTFAYLIALITVLGCVGVYRFAWSNQTYTASIILEYVNTNAAEGLTPAGTALDVSEIYSASVVTEAIKKLGLDTSVESIRSGITVTPVIPEDEETRKQALLEEGEEYEYFPTQYEVSFTGDSDTSYSYATDVLNAVVDCYLLQYSTKYIDDVSFPQNASNVSVEKYDYIECAQMLQESCNQIVGYLSQRAEGYPNFRSVQTGYSFDDLQDEYEYIRDNQLQKTYTIILNNRIVKDQDVLVTKYENALQLARIELQNCNTTLEKTGNLIRQFGDKTLEGSNYSFTGEDISSGLIIGDVELDSNHITNTITTYDKLIDEYLSLHSQRATLERSIAEYERLIATFSGAQAGQWISGQDSSTATRQIEEISAEMEELYDVVCDTVEEFNGVVSADNITPLTSVVSYSSLNLPMYTGLALIAFLFLSCCLAILLGRLGDFLNYFLYIDRKTNLPNRSRCDLQFDKYSARLLPDLFACLFIQFRFDAQEGVTRKSGDEALKKLGKILRDTLAPEGFIGYNNSGQFVGLFEQCGSEKMDTLVERIIAEIEYTNNLDQAGAIAVNIGYAVSSEDEIFEVRKLLHRAIERSKQ